MTKPQILVIVVVLVTVILVVANKCNREPELGEPLKGLTTEQLEMFNRGKEIFEREFRQADGLGPIFNAESCAECHEEPVVGGFGDEIEEHVSQLGPCGACDELIEHGGPVVQSRLTALLEINGGFSESVPGGAGSARRTTPHVLGFGLLDAVPDDVLRRLADSGQNPGFGKSPGVSGRLAVLSNGSIGRFGRKAGIAHLDEFADAALLQEQGITTDRFPEELKPNGKPLPKGADPVPDPELRPHESQALTAFLQFLAPPAPRSYSGKGRIIFETIGCAACHIPELQTGPSEIKALDRVTFAPYTDLLLHNLGQANADICMAAAMPAEFRTAPLMGVGLVDKFMHDGSAKTIEQAIMAHGGEADGARAEFESLRKDERKDLLKFLGSL